MFCIILLNKPNTGVPAILSDAKYKSEETFNQILIEIKNDPLSELIGEELPSPEEVFFAEWANDWFPHINISLIGAMIEEFGADKVGNINLDGEAPLADLNITIASNPSNITQEQCQALWDSKEPYSLLSESSSIWFEAANNDSMSSNILKNHFNLTHSQLTMICLWLQTSVNASLNGWIGNNANTKTAAYAPFEWLAYIILFAGVGILIWINNLVPPIKKTVKRGIKSALKIVQKSKGVRGSE